jgi:hypothetical protein
MRFEAGQFAQDLGAHARSRRSGLRGGRAGLGDGHGAAKKKQSSCESVPVIAEHDSPLSE